MLPVTSSAPVCGGGGGSEGDLGSGDAGRKGFCGTWAYRTLASVSAWMCGNAAHSADTNAFVCSVL